MSIFATLKLRPGKYSKIRFCSHKIEVYIAGLIVGLMPVTTSG
jgi:hypothetical protein